MKKIVIIGAGVAGLGAGHYLKKVGYDNFVIYEKSDTVGGLSASYKDENNFTWDIGGHVFFSHYKYFDRMIDEIYDDKAYFIHQREAWVRMLNEFHPYPFQYNIRRLPKETVAQIVEDMIYVAQNPPVIKPANFEEWILASFGKAFADVFMFPYNYKVWAYPPKKMSYGWIGERVATVNLQRLVGNILRDKDDIGWGPNNTFFFPKTRGTHDVYLRLEERMLSSKIVKNKSLVAVKENTVVFEDGSEDNFDVLISTIPLDSLVNITASVSTEAKEASKNLLYSSSNIVGIGLKGETPENLKTKCWMYFPEDNNPFYRVTAFSNYSHFNAPSENHHSLMCEVSESYDKAVDKDNIIEDVIDGLLKTQMLSSKNDIASTWYYRAEKGYPTPSLNRDKALSVILPEMQKRNIYSRGRFGGWKYEVGNMDHSFMQGVEAARNIVEGENEITYFNPSMVNSNIFK